LQFGLKLLNAALGTSSSKALAQLAYAIRHPGSVNPKPSYGPELKKLQTELHWDYGLKPKRKNC
jgi:hypothetical protein